MTRTVYSTAETKRLAAIPDEEFYPDEEGFGIDFRDIGLFTNPKPPGRGDWPMVSGGWFPGSIYMWFDEDPETSPEPASIGAGDDVPWSWHRLEFHTDLTDEGIIRVHTDTAVGCGDHIWAKSKDTPGANEMEPIYQFLSDIGCELVTGEHEMGR